MSSVPAPNTRVLSTLEQDGSRRWLKPRLSNGAFWRRRRFVAYALIVIYSTIPFIRIGDTPLVLLDVPARRFTIFAVTFLPTDTLLLALLLIAIILILFTLTAVLGRVWCGWACPHTVYMEFVFRPIERLFDGLRGVGGRPRSPPGFVQMAGKYVAYLAVSVALANTFLAYFVGVSQLRVWMTRSPFEHPMSFLVMASMTAAMMFHFSVFREQLCTLVCPYGRLQSVLLDRGSMVVRYDAARGEPKGPARRLPVLGEPPSGDCVDCHKCVRTCPTGIDIRDGLQMECVNCTQCIDACNEVMDKLGRRSGLVGYGVQARTGGLRWRLLGYSLLAAVAAAAFVTAVALRQDFDAVVLRAGGQPFSVADDGAIRNVFRLKLTNRASEAATYELTALAPGGARLRSVGPALVLEPGATATFPLIVLAPAAAFVSGRAQLTFEVRSSQEVQRFVTPLLGPAVAGAGAGDNNGA